MKKVRWMTAMLCAGLVMTGCGEIRTPLEPDVNNTNEYAGDAKQDTGADTDAADADTDVAVADEDSNSDNATEENTKTAEEEKSADANGSGSFTAPERKPLEEVSQVEGNTYTCTFDGVQHEFILDLPEQTENAPLIVMLHGYGMSAQMMREQVKMEEKALPMGYAVVYVTGTTNPLDRTSSTGWSPGIDDNPNDDVGMLAALVHYLQQEYSLSTDRVYGAGFSNGAMMMQRLAMDGQDIFSAVASVAGKMAKSVWERRYETNDIGVFQVTGEKDELVPRNADGSAKNAIDPAIEDVMDYWAASNGLTDSEESGIGKNSSIIKYEGEGKPVWSLVVRNGHHSWYDEKLTGIDLNGTILEFFEAAQ